MKYVDTATIDRSTTTLEDLDDILEAARETASVEVVEESPGRITGFRFEVEADDLWALHEIADETITRLDRQWEGLKVPSLDRAKVIE